MFQNEIIVKINHISITNDVSSSSVGRIVGLIDVVNFTKLAVHLNIDSNPRKPKKGKVTEDIISSLEDNPQLFHYLTKGILLSAASCSLLERNRIKLNFTNTNYALSGILDGGHNTFAIIKFLLMFFSDVVDKSVENISKIKDWDTLKKVWDDNASLLVEEVESNYKNEDSLLNSGLNFLIPIEIIYPTDSSNENILIEWGDSLRSITHARNNNAELTDATKDNYQGYYDYLKTRLSNHNLNKRIQWKTNDTGNIKVPDVIALSLIPLSKLPKELTGDIDLENHLVNIYNSKQNCVDLFRKILMLNGESTGNNFSLQNDIVKSALDIVPEILELYDLIYIKFPDAYNTDGGNFGRIDGVKFFDSEKIGPKYLKKYAKTKFLQKDSKYLYADGFITPLVVSLRELIAFNTDTNRMEWTVQNPHDYLLRKLPDILGIYGTVIRMSNYDPQKIGKDKGSYKLTAAAINS